MSVDYERKNAEIQKFYGNQLRTKKYLVNLSEIYLASPRIMRHDQLNRNGDDDGIPLHIEASEEENEPSVQDDIPLRRSNRKRTTPDWLATEEIHNTK